MCQIFYQLLKQRVICVDNFVKNLLLCVTVKSKIVQCQSEQSFVFSSVLSDRLSISAENSALIDH